MSPWQHTFLPKSLGWCVGIGGEPSSSLRFFNLDNEWDFLQGVKANNDAPSDLNLVSTTANCSLRLIQIPDKKEYHHRVSFKKGFFLPHFLSNRPLRAYLTGLVLRVDYIMYTEKTSSFDAMAIEKSRRTCSGEITNILTKYTLLHEENRTKTLKVKGWLFGRTHPPPLPPSSLLEREDRYWPT